MRTSFRIAAALFAATAMSCAVAALPPLPPRPAATLPQLPPRPPAGPQAQDPAPTPAPAPPAAPTRISVGAALFQDRTLSASGRMACASCHAAPSAHADPKGTFLPIGGPNLDQQGMRSSPSLWYAGSAGAFRFDAGRPVGGLMWDGRAPDRQAQARMPLLAPTEMANANAADFAARLRRTPYFADLARLYGVPAGATDEALLNVATLALAEFQAGAPIFALFNSRFDRVQDGLAQFTPQEARGLRWFNDPAKGNCASCHTSTPGADGSRPLFTSFGYAALGLPRNRGIRANADTNFFDMGLCGPARSDLATRVDLCGQFRIPSLRNVALTAPYFHNASAATLEQAVSFYATRDLQPGLWYPTVLGRPDKFNDLPLGYRGNVVRTAPFGQVPGSQPRLNAQDVADLVAFLHTLTDDPAAPPRTPRIGR